MIDERDKWQCCKDWKHSILRFVVALVIGLVASVNSVTVASAQTYPQRAIKFILPFGPAAGVDSTAPCSEASSRRDGASR